MKKDLDWSPVLIKMLRGKRTQEEFGRLLGVPKNTVWRWETGLATPGKENAARLSKLAERERFLADWKVAGSMILVGDLEEASKEIAKEFERALERSARELADSMPRRRR
jgi:transcriptional regulator with XRE-family HTH domain